MRVAVIGLLALLIVLGGCTAPAAVMRTHQIGLEATVNHAQGANAIIGELNDQLAKRDQRAIIDFTEQYLSRIEAAKAVDGATLAPAVRKLIELRDGLLVKAAARKAAVGSVRAENDRELTTYLRAHGLLSDYLLSGVDRAEVQPYVDALRAKIGSKAEEALADGDLDKLLEALK